MNRPDPPRGAGGRRRYVATWPRNMQRNRQRLGRVALMLGALILGISAVFTFGNKAEAPATTGLEPRSNGW